MGDVIRTTPIIQRLKEEYPHGKIFWLTEYPDVVPNIVDIVLPYTFQSIEYIKSIKFTWGVNLDKEPDACSVFNQCHIKNRFGYHLKDGMPSPVNNFAIHKYKTGISDTYSQQNNKHYIEEIFEMCDWAFNGEEYHLPDPIVNKTISVSNLSRPVIGLNTGCGGRWKTRLWPTEYWTELIEILQSNQFTVVVLGGPDENEKNLQLSKETGAQYFGVLPIGDFHYLISKCDIIVTAVTMAMHLAIGLKKPMVLFNNIFNPNEFYFYTPSKIISPSTGCDCYFAPECKRENACMKDIHPEDVYHAVSNLT